METLKLNVVWTGDPELREPFGEFIAELAAEINLGGQSLEVRQQFEGLNWPELYPVMAGVRDDGEPAWRFLRRMSLESGRHTVADYLELLRTLCVNASPYPAGNPALN